jgi:NhaP-type Na+/H+ or K+/H+ antiporter
VPKCPNAHTRSTNLSLRTPALPNSTICAPLLQYMNASLLVGECLDYSVNDPTSFGMFAMVVLAAGVLLQMSLRSSSRFTPVPYTLTMMIFGMVIGGIDIATGSTMGGLSFSMHKWLDMYPFALFYLFVPALLFPACFNADYHVWTKVLPQCIVLAVLGVLLSVLSTAVVAKFVFAYNWTWIESLMFGAMLSATDPVAVISLLKDLGAPWSVGMVIEGESLLNDGTAFVIFLALEKAATGVDPDYSAGAIVGDMVYASVVGPLLGAASALLCIALLNALWDDAVLGVTVTMLGAWGSFFLGNLVGASGLLAVCTCGILLAGYLGAYVDPGAAEEIRAFWDIVDFVANTMVFGFAGFVVVVKLDATPEIGSAYDFGMIAVNYVFLNVFRFLAVAALWWPWLSKTGYGMDWRKYVIVSWAGLRGGAWGSVRCAHPLTQRAVPSHWFDCRAHPGRGVQMSTRPPARDARAPALVPQHADRQLDDVPDGRNCVSDLGHQRPRHQTLAGMRQIGQEVRGRVGSARARHAQTGQGCG